MENTKEKLEILIGDDLFRMPMESIQIERNYLTPLKDALSKNYDTKITQAQNPEQMLEEASKDIYYVIISDLDYQTTDRVGTEGYKVFDSINKMVLTKKPFRILCTSTDNQKEEIEKRIVDGKIDAYVGAKSKIKFQNLIDFMIKKYRPQQRALAEGKKLLQKDR